jgi:hypothetical protein
MGRAGHVAQMILYRVLLRKPEVKRALGRRRRRWKNNSKKGLREIGRGVMNFIDADQEQGPVAGSCEHGNER